MPGCGQQSGSKAGAPKPGASACQATRSRLCSRALQAQGSRLDGWQRETRNNGSLTLLAGAEEGCACGSAPSSPSLCTLSRQELLKHQGMAGAWRKEALERRWQPYAAKDVDDGLTNLMWLKDFTVADTGMPRPPYLSKGPEFHACYKFPCFAAPCSPLAADPACMGIPHTPCNPISSSTSRTMHHAVAMHSQATEDVDYKTNPYVKPPYSYAKLICMAMEASSQPKITLSAIYKWITDNFCYFQHADPTWQNSIRHNLSLNKCFIKVPREKGEPGKGGFWKLDPQHAERLKNGAFKKRRVSPQIHPALTKRVQQAAQGVAGPATSVCTIESILSVDKESQKLLREFEAMTGEHQGSPAGGKAGQNRKLPSPKHRAKASRLSNTPLLTQEQALLAQDQALTFQEEEDDLMLLKGDFDWESILNTNLDVDLSIFEDTVHGHQVDAAQGQEQGQVLTESSQTDLDCEETFRATSFLELHREEGTNLDALNVDQLLNVSLPVDLNDWTSVTALF
ncbi:forkhead box protein J1 [Rhynochetos jubatus]